MLMKGGRGMRTRARTTLFSSPVPASIRDIEVVTLVPLTVLGLALWTIVDLAEV